MTLVAMFDSVGSGIYTGRTNMSLHVCIVGFFFSWNVNILVVDFG